MVFIVVVSAAVVVLASYGRWWLQNVVEVVLVVVASAVQVDVGFGRWC